MASRVRFRCFGQDVAVAARPLLNEVGDRDQETKECRLEIKNFVVVPAAAAVVEPNC